MKRNNLFVRFSTSVGQKLPSDWEAKVTKFRLYLRENFLMYTAHVNFLRI